MGKIQGADIKTSAELATAGADDTYLPLDSQVYVEANGINKRLDQAITDGDIGGSGGGSKNYLTKYLTNPGNGDFERNTTAGWSLFNTTLTQKFPDAAPSAGAGNVTTFDIVSSGQLAGKYSLRTASSSTWGAGQGFISDSFEIDSEDQAKAFKFKFYFKVTAGSGNLVFASDTTGSFGVAIYDVDNAQWIQPTNSFFLNDGGIGIAEGSFQTSFDGLNYQIAIYAANTTAGAATILWDDFSFGPDAPMVQPRSLGLRAKVANVVGISASTNFYPVYNTVEYDDFGMYNSTTGEATIKVPGRIRVKGSIIISGIYSLANAISCRVFKNGSAVNDNFQRVAALGSSSIPQDADATFDVNVGDVIKIQSYCEAATPSLLGDALYDYFEVIYESIDSQSSSLVSEIYFRASSATNPHTASTNSVFAWDQADVDTKNAFNPTTGLYTVKEPGPYFFSFSNILSADADIGFLVNSTQYLVSSQTAAMNRVGGNSILLVLKTGDTVGVFTDATTTMNASIFNWFSGFRINTAVNSGSDRKVTFKAIKTAGFATTTATSQDVIYDTIVYDDVGGYNPSTGEYTFKVPGKHQISGCVFWDTSSSGHRELVSYVNGTLYDTLSYLAANASIPTFSVGTVYLDAKVGDVLKLQSYQDSGGALTYNSAASGALNWFSIVKVG